MGFIALQAVESAGQLYNKQSDEYQKNLDAELKRLSNMKILQCSVKLKNFIKLFVIVLTNLHLVKFRWKTWISVKMLQICEEKIIYLILF